MSGWVRTGEREDADLSGLDTMPILQRDCEDAQKYDRVAEISFIVLGFVVGIVLCGLASYCYCMYRRRPELFRRDLIQAQAQAQAPIVLVNSHPYPYPQPPPPPPATIPPASATGPQVVQLEGDDIRDGDGDGGEDGLVHDGDDVDGPIHDGDGDGDGVAVGHGRHGDDLVDARHNLNLGPQPQQQQQAKAERIGGDHEGVVN